jgi:hypothetical protein
MSNPILTNIAVSIFICAASASASMSPLVSVEEKARAAEAVAVGQVVSLKPYRDEAGMIWTRAAIRIDERFKGKLPEALELKLPGGRIDHDEEVNGYSPALRIGESRLFFFERGRSGRLSLVAGSAGALALAGADPGLLPRTRAAARQGGRAAADLSDFATDASNSTAPSDVQTLTDDGVAGLLLSNGFPGRYLAPDRGEPIPYLVDAETLPTGITLALALQAVENAFAAWSEVTLLKFRFEGLQNFGTHAPAAESSANDGRIRVQLHDLHAFLGSSSILGFAGSHRQSSPSLPNGGWGGRVKNLEFNRSVRGYVVLNHNSALMSNLSVFEQTLCHEIGHVLGIAHSSENSSETDPFLLASIMFYQIRDNTRGAVLGDWEIPVLCKAHPHDNTPPFAYSRSLYSVNSQLPLANPEVNWVRVAFDLQNDPLTHETLAESVFNGSFAVVNGVARFTPTKADNTPSDANYSTLSIRVGDGVNLSPPASVTVRRYQADNHPAGAPDGLPDSWMILHFGSAVPLAGVSGPHDDPDGDGQTNLQEFAAGTNPLNANSLLKVTELSENSIQWQSRNWGLYSLETSADLFSWKPVGGPLLATGAATTAPLPPKESPRAFYRIRLNP